MSEELDEIEKLSKGVPIWVKSIVFIIVATAISFSTYKAVLMEWFPEMFTIEADEAMIHNEVDHLKEEVSKELVLKFQEQLTIAEKEHNRNRAEIVALRQEINSYKDLFEGLQKQTDFNTQVLSITNQVVIEELDAKQNDCGFTYYESNTKDNWAIFKDYYDCQVIYSVDLRSGCRAFYTPIFRSKIQAN